MAGSVEERLEIYWNGTYSGSTIETMEKKIHNWASVVWWDTSDTVYRYSG